MENGNWRIGIVEDEENFRIAIHERISEIPSVLEIFSWRSAEEFLRDDLLEKLDLVLVDIRLPHMNGIELLGCLERRSPRLKKVILSSLQTDRDIFDAIKNGALGYIQKGDLDRLRERVEVVLEGGAVITPSIALRIMNFIKARGSSQDDGGVVQLTDRERQILKLLTEGYTIPRLAALLNISENTARSHVKSIYQKLQVKNRVELMQRVHLHKTL